MANAQGVRANPRRAGPHFPPAPRASWLSASSLRRHFAGTKGSLLTGSNCSPSSPDYSSESCHSDERPAQTASTGGLRTSAQGSRSGAREAPRRSLRESQLPSRRCLFVRFARASIMSARHVLAITEQHNASNHLQNRALPNSVKCICLFGNRIFYHVSSGGPPSSNHQWYLVTTPSLNMMCRPEYPIP